MQCEASVKEFDDIMHPPLVAVAQEGVRVSAWGPQFCGAARYELRGLDLQVLPPRRRRPVVGR